MTIFARVPTPWRCQCTTYGICTLCQRDKPIGKEIVKKLETYYGRRLHKQASEGKK